MQEKKNQQPMQNIHMMRCKPREENPSVNIAMRSGIATGEGKVEGKSDTCIHRADEKNNGFDLQREKGTFMEEIIFFMDPGASMSKT